MPAELITRFKDITPDGGVIKWAVWRLPQPVPPSVHGNKHRAVYAHNGARIVGFANEFEKGLTRTGTGSGRTDGFADVWLQVHFTWEYKAPGKRLDGALKPLMM